MKVAPGGSGGGWRGRASGRVCRRFLAGMLLAAALCGLLAGCAARPAEPSARVLVDGQPWTGSGDDAGADGLRVIVTLDGQALIDLPFGTPHTVSIVQPDGAENVVALTETAVRMASANCENQDCVHMAEVTRENLELRVMGGFIICLPHKLSVEVRGD